MRQMLGWSVARFNWMLRSGGLAPCPSPVFPKLQSMWPPHESSLSSAFHVLSRALYRGGTQAYTHTQILTKMIILWCILRDCVYVSILIGIVAVNFPWGVFINHQSRAAWNVPNLYLNSIGFTREVVGRESLKLWKHCPSPFTLLLGVGMDEYNCFETMNTRSPDSYIHSFIHNATIYGAL